MGIKLSNNAFGTLAAGINSSATSITLTSGQGARFPTLGAGDYFYATLVDTSNNLEIVKCTARSTDVLTVVRAQESTTARAYSAGDRLEIRLTAQTFVDAVNEIGPTQVSDELNSSTGYFDLPSGTTAQRPASPTDGMTRVNTDLHNLEFYENGVWKQPNLTYQVEVLLVAGGASGGTGGTNDSGGGGGAGGVVPPQTTVATGGVSYTVTVGGGGASVGAGQNGNSGSNSLVSGLTTTTAIGGGFGVGESVSRVGGNGGSGGGAGGYSGSPGSGTAGQGNNGASVGTQGTGSSGGGGGAGAAATNMAGGAGTSAYSTWASATSSGVSGFFGGGGGGAGDQRNTTTGGAGGSGGGGAGQTASGGQVPGNGTANTGGGGGGGGGSNYVSPNYSGNGGSGIVIIRYLGTQRATGGTAYTTGGYTYHKFTSSGTFTA